MKIKKDDQIYISAGKDRGKRGKVVRTILSDGKIVVEGLNLVKRHIRPKREGKKGQRVDIPMPLDVSKVSLVCPKCGKLARVGYSFEGKEKVRVCKKCSAIIA